MTNLPPRMRIPVIRLMALVLFALVPCSAAAQVLDALQWERLGSGTSDLEEARVDGLAFRHGAVSDGSLDTLYAVNGDGVFRLAPGADEWEEMCPHTWCRGIYIATTKEGYLLVGSPTGPAGDGARSTDGGRIWENDVVGVSVTVLFQSTLPALGGAVYACDAADCARSFDGGATGSWTSGKPLGGSPAALAEITPSTALPNGRLLGGAWNGAAYSDDGAQTWTPSSLWQPGRFVVNSLTFAPDAAHPFGGVVYAGVRDFGLGRPAVYRSDDAGQTWTLVLEVNPGDYGLPGPDWIVVQASGAEDGVVYAGVEDIPGGTTRSPGTVLASADGGQTWVQVADSTNGWGGYGVNVFEVGRDGRLYAGTDRGVYRTVEPVSVSVEEEPQMPGKSSIALYPNPMTGETTVALVLGEAARVRITLYDVLGRRVAVAADRAFAAGSHTVRLDGSALPAGVYLVRAVIEGERALTQPVTVIR